MRKHHLLQTYRYPVRMALIDLDDPPEWWNSRNSDFLTAQEARDLVSTKGENSLPFFYIFAHTTLHISRRLMLRCADAQQKY